MKYNISRFQYRIEFSDIVDSYIDFAMAFVRVFRWAICDRKWWSIPFFLFVFSAVVSSMAIVFAFIMVLATCTVLFMDFFVWIADFFVWIAKFFCWLNMVTRKKT